MSTKLVIVGGVAAGASAATKARREDELAEIILVEKGPYVSYANCGLPYYVSGEIGDRGKLLVTTPQVFEKRFNVKVLLRNEAVGINLHQRTLEVRDLEKSQTIELPYDALILAPGAAPIVPPFPGKDAPNFFQLRNVPDADGLYELLSVRKPKRALVVGGGFIGLECAEAFARRGLEVTLVEKLEHVLPNLDEDMAAYVEGALEEIGVRLVLGRGVQAFEKNDQGFIVKAFLEGGDAIECDLVLLAIGVRPDAKLAKEAGIAIGETGAIKVNDRMETSVPGVFAAGDAVESLNLVTGRPGWFALAGPANQQGRVAGANAVGKDLRFKGTLGTFIVRAGKAVAAKTGLSEKEALKEGYDVCKVLIHPNHHAGYYPGAKPLHMKVLAEKGTGRLLGAQIVGEEGVDKRIDVLSSALFFKANVQDLADLNLAYAPPFGSARDPVNQAGLVGSHLVSGEIDSYDPVRAARGSDSDKDSVVFLDVREPKEFEEEHIPEAINVPLSVLRQSVDKLKEVLGEKQAVLYCNVGYRSYLAYRALKHRGIQGLKGLLGGFASFKVLQEKAQMEAKNGNES